MCSVDDETLPMPHSKRDVSSKCMKCKRPAVAIARIKDPFCRECFLAYFTHRFRATFGKSKLVRQNEKVLVAFSGGQSSSVLLDLVKQGLSESVHKKLRFIPTIIIVDDGAIFHQSWEDRIKLLSERITVATQSGFPVFCTRLEEVFGSYHLWCGNHWQPVSYDPKQDSRSTSDSETVEEKVCTVNRVCDNCHHPLHDAEELLDGLATLQLHSTHTSCGRNVLQQYGRCLECEEKLVKLFDNTTTITAKEDLLHSLRRQLVVMVARRLSCSKVIVGDNETRLSVRLFSDIAQGRGQAAPLDTGFSDDRFSDVMIIRPMREFPSQEIAAYCVLFNLTVTTTPSFTAVAHEKASIEKLTESFIAGLQRDFPSTVNTIFRTGDKLTMQNGSQSQRCQLCMAPVDDSKGLLCYGCQLTVKDINKDVSLPPHVLRDRVKDHLL